MINLKELEKYDTTYSVDRLSGFIYSTSDTVDDILNHYCDNIKISQALYPDLCTFEIILRNAIDKVLRTYISKTWIDDEINNNKLLEPYDFQTLLKAYNSTKDDCKASSKPFTHGRVVANLNLGFWTNLCVKKYSPKIWNRMCCFKGVFVNYPSYKPEMSKISKKLYSIRKLRNRVFHYEKIFKNPQNLLNLYNEILNFISYLPNDQFDVLNKTSNFLTVYNELMLCANKKT